MLTRAAQGLLGQMIAAYQAAASNGSYGLDSSSGGIRFVLHGGDGLQLCSSVSSSLRDTLFDAIDASNMGDHVGEFLCTWLQLPVAKARLRWQPARIHMNWEEKMLHGIQMEPSIRLDGFDHCLCSPTRAS